MYCSEQYKRNVEYYRWLNPSRPPRPWGLGRIYQSMTFLFQLTGSQVRTPGRYTRTNPKTNEPTTARLFDTEETIHPSVRIRQELDGRGPDDKGSYRPKPLSSWLCLAPEDPAPKMFNASSINEGDDGQSYRWVSDWAGDVVVLPEAKLGEAELELLQLSPEVYKKYIATLRVQ